MSNQVSHISAEDEDGNVIVPLSGKGNCFTTWTIPRKGDKVQIDDRNGEWEVVDVIHTLVAGMGSAPVSLRLREVSSRVSEEA